MISQVHNSIRENDILITSHWLCIGYMLLVILLEQWEPLDWGLVSLFTRVLFIP